MKGDKKEIWIEKGYGLLANNGPTNLRIEPLAKIVGKNKSSFYHFFADLDVFIGELLKHHIDIVKFIAEKEANALDENELIQIFIEHKTDFLFNRQLRINRENKDFEACFLKTNEISKPAILPLWGKIIGLEENHYLAQIVFMLSIENFFLQITDETLTEQWLTEYFVGVKSLVGQFKLEKQKPSIEQ